MNKIKVFTEMVMVFSFFVFAVNAFANDTILVSSEKYVNRIEKKMSDVNVMNEDIAFLQKGLLAKVHKGKPASAIIENVPLNTPMPALMTPLVSTLSPLSTFSENEDLIGK